MPAADQAIVRQPRQRPPKARPQWPMSIAILFGLASALGGLGAAFTEASWWFVAVGVAALVTVALGTARAYARWAFIVPLVGVVVTIICLTFSFAPTYAWAGFIPNFDVTQVFGELLQDGIDSIADQSIPADPVPGIVFLATIGSAVLAIMLDGLAFVAKRPALIGIPLLAVLMVPTFFATDQHDPVFFFLTAAAYLLILYLGLGEVRTGGAIGVGATGVAIALILPLVLPPVAEQVPESTGAGFAVGVNAFITLGENLRRDGESRVITYTTTASQGVYLTVSVIDEFEGERWSPAAPVVHAGARLDNIGRIPGLDDGIDVLESTTSITIVNMGGHWLPAPYAPRLVTGADANWTYDEESLSINSPTESARGEVYQVTSQIANPTVDQLRASGDAVGTDVARFLELPDELDGIVAATAQEVTAGLTTHFDQAMALQNYFTDGQFEYSETAPVEEGYDGTGAGVVGEFLIKKSGYCVHFSSSMAIMARSLGIPSRVAVGFTPGEFTRSNNDDPDYFAVTTRNLHAWPELWFQGIGWVRFEPTPGRGELPVFAQNEIDAPNTAPTPTGATAPTSTPVPTTTPTSTATLAPETGGQSSSFNQAIPRIVIGILIGAALVVLLLPLVPMVVRAARRTRRYWRVRRHGMATEAWAELNDTAIDLGWNAATTTPRQFAQLMRRGMPESTVAALARLLVAVEATAFSPDSGTSTLADLRLVRRAMWRVSSRRERLGATLSPASAARWAGALKRRLGVSA